MHSTLVPDMVDMREDGGERFVIRIDLLQIVYNIPIVTHQSHRDSWKSNRLVKIKRLVCTKAMK